MVLQVRFWENKWEALWLQWLRRTKEEDAFSVSFRITCRLRKVALRKGG
jgi:hypothetical protein